MKHFGARCPHRKSTEEAQMVTNTTLLAGKGDAEQCYLMPESLGYSVLDTTCTKTVAGTEWVNEYMASLAEPERAGIKRSGPSTQSAYRFEDGLSHKV